MSKASDATARVSALVVAHDEQENLADCLATLGFCDEIVVVLDRCSDGSKTVAGRFTERIIAGSWPVEGARRNAGIDACDGEWILEVDADERVSPELAAEIRGAVEADACDYHRMPVDNYLGGRLVRHGWGAQFGRSSHVGLFRKGTKRWGDQRVHPKLHVAEDARAGPRLENRLIHYIDRDISGLIRRLDRYTTARARDLRESGDIGSAFHNYRRIVSRFWKCFVGRKGYKEGGLGFLIALCAGLYPILSYLKARYEED
jgi:glycosyltransferase involved in cell wall biosynthesis